VASLAVVSRSIVIRKVLRSSNAWEGIVMVMIEEGPAEVAPFVSRRYRFLFIPVKLAVAKLTSRGITSISIHLLNKKVYRAN
jgi:hypothetical protein